MPDDHLIPKKGQRLVHRQYTSVKAVIEQVGAKFITLRISNTGRLTNINKLILWEHYKLEGMDEQAG